MSRVVLVTGGARGIGAGIAAAFAEQGDTVVICGRTPPEDSPHTFVSCDVRDADATQAMVDGIVAEHRRLDVLVNNAGGSPYADTATASPRFTTKVIQLNLIAPMVLAQQANAVMQKQGSGGVILNIASVAGTRPAPNIAAYGAAKAGLINVTKTLAMEFAPKVRVMSIAPGWVSTAITDSYPQKDAICETVPMGRYGMPSEVAAACLFFASDAGAFASGSNLVMDGGGERPSFLLAIAHAEEKA